MARSTTHRQRIKPSLVSRKDAIAAATDYVKGNRSRGTWRAYATDWAVFQSWCRRVGLRALPATPRTVALFLTAEGKRRRAPSTLNRRLSAIRLMHIGAGYLPPNEALEVSDVMRGIRRVWQRPVTQKAPATDKDIKRMVDAVEPDTLRGLRDRALILLGFAGALRRSELVALDTGHLSADKEGLSVTITSSSTDQEGHGQTVTISRIPRSPYCPVQAVSDWLVAAKIRQGPVFRRFYRLDALAKSRLTGQSVALIVKELAAKAGLASGRYAANSLRSGFITSAARNSASLLYMADQSRHRSLDFILEYVRAQRRTGNPADVGLLE
jgi:site-specific recombinase XerD